MLSTPTGKREIGNEAVWTLSTAKPGNGIDQLRDNNRDTFWQYVFIYSFLNLLLVYMISVNIHILRYLMFNLLFVWVIC